MGKFMPGNTAGDDDGGGAGRERDAGVVGERRDLERDASTDPRGHRVGVDDGADPPSHNDGSVDANSDAAVPSLLVLLGFLFVIFLRMHI